jgi:mRNA-degrading endonuclease YafQ of YafQ-DinJ toxin-antitoxin module
MVLPRPLRPAFTGQFKRDRKRAINRNQDVDHLGRVIVFVRTGSHADLFE